MINTRGIVINHLPLPGRVMPSPASHLTGVYVSSIGVCWSRQKLTYRGKARLTTAAITILSVEHHSPRWQMPRIVISGQILCFLIDTKSLVKRSQGFPTCDQDPS